MLIALLLSSCEKELDFEYHDIPAIPVVEGELSNDGVSVSLTQTTPMDESLDVTRLTDATVTLTDLTAGKESTLLPDADGFFRATDGGMIGHDYRLTVERGGSRFEATTTMLPATEIVGLEFNWIAMPYDDVAVLQGKFRTVEATHCYWARVYRNGEVYFWQEMKDFTAVDGVVTFTVMTTRRDISAVDDNDDRVIYDGDVITVSITPITEEMHDYLEALKNGSNGPAMFSGPKCLGFFMASTPVSSSIVFHPDEIPEYK